MTKLCTHSYIEAPRCSLDIGWKVKGQGRMVWKWVVMGCGPWGLSACLVLSLWSNCPACRHVWSYWENFYPYISQIRDVLYFIVILCNLLFFLFNGLYTLCVHLLNC